MKCFTHFKALEKILDLYFFSFAFNSIWNFGFVECFAFLRFTKNCKQQKKHPFEVLFVLFRGPERIRTAVEAFAELCLASRPQDHILSLTTLTYHLNNFDFRAKPRNRIAKVQDSCQTPKDFVEKNINFL